jgi:membrane-associated HD superfamily phosphohydrolase
MVSKSAKLVFLFSLILLGVSVASAQFERNPQPKVDLPDAMKENLAKRRIKDEKEEYEELIKRGEEAVKISEELSKSYEENKKLSGEDQKKLEKLEKVVKRIRRDLGAEDDDKNEQADKPSSMLNTLDTIKEKTSNLLTELKKASRYSISVVAVESSNTVFRLIKFLRFNKS